MDDVKIETLSTRTLLEKGKEEKSDFMRFTSTDLRKTFNGSGSFNKFFNPVIDIYNKSIKF